MFKTRTLGDSHPQKKTVEDRNELDQPMLREHQESQIDECNSHRRVEHEDIEHDPSSLEEHLDEQEQQLLKQLEQLKLRKQRAQVQKYPDQDHPQQAQKHEYSEQQTEYPEHQTQYPKQQDLQQQRYLESEQQHQQYSEQQKPNEQFWAQQQPRSFEIKKQQRRGAPLQQYNILLFGETGAGKSTLINYITNYFLRGSIHKLRIAIPTKHHQATEGWKYSEKDLHDETKSKTSECITYTFPTDVACYNFIDTPGLSDTEGTAKDDEHIMKIMAAAESKGTLSAIIIVVNGTMSRATVNLRNTLTLLKSSVPDVLLKNLVVVLTNCSKSSASFNLKQLNPWKVPNDNVFHMNNSALVKSVHEWREDVEMMDELMEHWKKSMKTIEKITQKIKKLGNKTTSAFKDMRLKRNKIKAELHGILLEVKKLQRMQDQLICAQTAEKDITTDIKKYENYKQTRQVDYVELEAAPYHSTICMKHTTVCHEGCGLSFTSTQGDNIFKGCACMSGANCRVCECDHSTHYHDMKKPVKKTKTVEDILHDVKALHDKHTNKKAQLQKKINSLSSDIDSLKNALDNKEAGIKKCCEELKTLCSYFNFVDELRSVIDTMERDARTLTNMQARQDAEARINNIVHIANQLSATM